MSRLECWNEDRGLFTGFIYGLPHFDDGQPFSTTANFTDWPDRKITVGETRIELGTHRSELEPTELFNETV